MDRAASFLLTEAWKLICDRFLYISRMFSSQKRRVVHTVFIPYRAPEEISAQNAVQGYQSICCSSMADHSVFHCHFVYSPRVPQSTANQNASKTYLESMKPDEDHSFLQRVPKINAQSLKQNGLRPSPSFLSLMLYLVFYLPPLLFFSYKNYEKTIVKVVDEILENCKQFLLR